MNRLKLNKIQKKYKNILNWLKKVIFLIKDSRDGYQDKYIVVVEQILIDCH